MINNDFFYEFKYYDGDREINMKFSADVDITRMRENIRDFLCGTSWYESQVEGIIGEDE